MDWVTIIVGGVMSGGLISAVLVFISTRRRDSVAAIAERFDDAAQLTAYVRDEVERQLAPIRAELEQVRREADETRNAFREWIVGVWRWDRLGRKDDLPMPPPEVLSNLNLHHLADSWPTEPSNRKEG